jgi:hypothetical protein
MKNGLYPLLAVALVVGAIFYSNSVVLGKEPGSKSSPSPSVARVSLMSHQEKTNKTNARDQNSAQAGASNGDNNDLAEKALPGASGHPVVVVKRQPAATRHAVAQQQNTSVSQQANAVAVANGTGAQAKAVAINNTTVNNVTNQTVETIRPLPSQEVPQAELERKVVVAQTEQPVVVTQAPSVPVAQPLPATGDLALSGLIGTSAVAGAAYSYIRSRRSLLDTRRGRPR